MKSVTFVSLFEVLAFLKKKGQPRSLFTPPLLVIFISFLGVTAAWAQVDVTANITLALPNPDSVDSSDCGINTAVLSFAELKAFYGVGDRIVVDLYEQVQACTRSSRVDLWVAVEIPSGDLYFKTSNPSSPFSLLPQPFKTGLETSEATHHILDFEIVPGMEGNYNFYAVFVEEETNPIEDGFIVRRSNIATIRTTVKYFPGVIEYEPERVGPGVTFRRASEESKHWEISIIEVDLNNPNLDIEVLNPTEHPLEETSQQAMAANAIAAVNGTFFDMQNAQYFGFQKVNSIITRCYQPPTSLHNPPPDVPTPLFTQPWYAFGLGGTYNKTAMFEQIWPCGESLDGNREWDNVIDALGSYPNLVKEGKIDYEQVNGTLFGWEKKTAPRTWIGLDTKANRLYLLGVDGRVENPTAGEKKRIGMTSLEQAQFLLDLGCDYGLNLDGGGSTTVWVNGEVKNHLVGSERKVATVLAVIPANIVDNETKECSKTGTSWTEVVYSDSYYLDSLKIGTEDKETVVTWRPNLEEPGNYEVFVWYPTDINQSNNVIYTVVDDNNEYKVPLNQQINGGQWNTLGTYSFSPGTKGFVSLTNATLSSGYIVTDAVKFLYKGSQ